MRYVLFIVAVAALCGCAKEQKTAFTAAHDGRVMSDIVIPADAKGVERYAAE